MKNFIGSIDSAYVPMMGLDNAIDSLDIYLKVSDGQPTVSDTEIKLSLLTLKTALDQQLKINLNLIERITQLETKKKNRFRFWK